MFKRLLLSGFVALAMATPSFGAHPLITDDTGTQGKGKFQLEVNGQYDHEKDDGVTTKGVQVAAALTYGIADPLDIVICFPYQHISTKDTGTVTGDGVSDLSLEVKWRFYEAEGLSFALKPGITLPTGDAEKSLGPGRVTYHLFLITTKEMKPWAFHLTLGYIRNKNTRDERRNMWHASLASTFELTKNLKAVANIGIQSNTDRLANIPPAFLLAGIIYSLSENFDLDFGVKGGLDKPETDYSILAGMTWRF